MKRPYILAFLLLAGSWLPAVPLTAQTGSGLANMSIADVKAKDPALVAARHLARAERALAKAQRLHAEGAENPKAAKKAAKACKLAIREAGAAIASDAGSMRAHFVRGQARLMEGDAEGARDDCLMAFSHNQEDTEALFCYGRASLGSGQGGQALSAYKKLHDMEADPAMVQTLLTEIRGWVSADPTGADRQAVARWLEQNLEGG